MKRVNFQGNLKSVIAAITRIKKIVVRLCAVLILTNGLFISSLYAASCSDVFPGATTANITKELTLPTLTGTLPLWKFLFDATYSAGDYHYTWGSISNNVKIKASGGASVRLYFKGNVTISDNVKMLDGKEEDLIVIIEGNLTVEDKVKLKGFYYVKGNVEFNDDSEIKGAISATGNITINGSKVKTDYKADKLAKADFNSMCTQGADEGCSKVFSGALVPSTANTLSLPAFTGSSALNLTSGKTTFATGDFHYTTGNMSGSAKLKTSGPTTRLYFNGNVTLEDDAKITEKDADELIIIIKGNLTVKDHAKVKGFVYVQGNVTLEDRADIKGSLVATGTITTLGSKVKTKYESSKLSTVEFSTLCGEGAVTTLDHFAYTVSTAASVCTAHSVTITAQDSSNATITGYTGSITLSTSTSNGNWAVTTATNAINNGTSDDGGATYTFAAGDSGDIVLTLANEHADTLTITTTDSSASKSTTSSSITYTDNTFVFSTGDSLASDVVAGRDHSFTVSYMKKNPSPSSTTCSVASGYTGSKSLKAWVAKHGDDPSGTAPKINSGSSLPSSVGGSNNVSLTFSSGVANFTLNTFDVGKYALNLRDDSGGFATATINGASDTYVIRPFGLYIAVTGNSAASSHSGTKFKKAGEAFTVVVTGVLYASADDQYNTAGSATPDGFPDYHSDTTPSNNANLSNNTAAPSFGGESETVALTALLYDPSPAGGANDPGLSGTTSISSFSSGVGSSTNVKYTEVGIIEITAQLTDSNYLASGKNVYGKSGYVGRLYPDHYTLSANTPALADGGASWTCDFTYQGQTFGFSTDPVITVTAVNAGGTATKNFGGDYWKLSAPTSHSFAATGLPSGTSTALSHNSASTTYVYTNTGLSGYDGVGTLTIASDAFTFTRNNSRPASGDVAFTPSLAMTFIASQFTDPDGACYESASSCASYAVSSIGGTEIRYGRVVLDEAFGSELLALPMATRIEYYATTGSSTAFVVNSADNNSCTGTSLGSGNITLSNYLGNLSSGETTASLSGYSSGVGTINFTAPGSGNDGQVKTTLNVPAYLEYNWFDTGLADPVAAGVFGIYEGNETIFYFRESYR
ncbi:MAG: hypothetical protein COB04_07230 [Gammaproteobacteria bacterium]|nr:MAG: hypothetical protein COB04_07230 [Gammaproteobacteria bacterium]